MTESEDEELNALIEKTLKTAESNPFRAEIDPRASTRGATRARVFGPKRSLLGMVSNDRSCSQTMVVLLMTV